MVNNMKKRIIIILFCFISILAILHFTINRNKSFPPEQIMKDSFLYINKIISTPFKSIENLINEIKTKSNLYKKYQKLEKQLSDYEDIKVMNTNLNNTINELKKVLEINNTLEEKTYLNATVINRNVGQWYETITIDKGTNHGIINDLAVINSDGLIGKVIETSLTTSKIKLITSSDIYNKISVKILNENESYYGILSSYDEKNKVFKVEGVDNTADIKEGMLVTTSGLSDIFPGGILIGKVSEITTDHFELAKIIKVKTDINFNNISFVTILKKDIK